MIPVLRLAVAGLAGGALVVGGASLAGADQGGRHVQDVRDATAAFFDVDEAIEQGWSIELADLAGITCIDSPDGAMGVHYVNGTLVSDAEIDELMPEALVYEPQPDGDLHLVAVEYVVIADAWHDAHRKQPPKLFGQKFTLVPAGNRYGLPDFYELHLWAWETNPAGLFQDWNPDVTCP